MTFVTKGWVQQGLAAHKELQETVSAKKYQLREEKSFKDVKQRIVDITLKNLYPHLPESFKYDFSEMVQAGRMLPAGSILSGLGNEEYKCSLSNCYLTKIEQDSIEGIFEGFKKLARTYSYRGGSGLDITILRPKGFPVNNAARTSSGAVSFMPLMSDVTGTIGQSGRRGALIISLDVRHPDIPYFIDSKADPERIFGVDSLTGKVRDVHNANISVKLTDEFMEAVNNDEIWDFVFPDRDADPGLYDTKWDGDYDNWQQLGGVLKVYSSIPARAVLLQIAKAAWTCGDPGVLFIDTIQKNTPGTHIDENLLKPQGVNPCFPRGSLLLDVDRLRNIEDQNAESWTSWCTGEREVIKVTTNIGLEFECTPDHKLKLDNGKDLEASKCIGKALFNPGNFISYIRREAVDAEVELSGKNFGVKSFTERESTLPKDILYGDKHKVADFLKGWFEIEQSSFLCVKSHKLAQDLQVLLLSFGILTRVSTGKQGYVVQVSPYYIDRLERTIGCKVFSVLAEVCDGSNPTQIKVTGYESVGIKEVWDFKMNRPPSFNFCNGVIAHNCGEQPLPNWGNCLLTPVCLHKYVKNPWSPHAEFDHDLFLEDIERTVIFLNIMSDINENLHPLAEQRETDAYGKRIGVEFTGLADMLAMLGLSYDSDQALCFVTKIMAEKAIKEIETSNALAQKLGCCKAFESEKSREDFLYCDYVVNLCLPEWLKDDITRYGLRNSAFNTVGPTGSVSIMSDNCTSGIEPLFMFQYKRRSRTTGKEHTLVHMPVLQHLNTLTDEELSVLTIDGLKEKFNYQEAAEIHPMDRLMMQKTVQDCTDASISSTLNLPAHDSVEDIYAIYHNAYSLGLKGITVFREGSKQGVLSGIGKTETEKSSITAAPYGGMYVKELLDVERAERHRVLWKGAKMYVIISLDDDDLPVEIFVKLPREAGFNGDGTYKESIYQEKFSLWEAVTRLTSLLLRSSMPLEKIIKQLDKSSYSLVDASAVIARLLRKYLPHPDVEDLSPEEIVDNSLGVECKECHQFTFVYEGGCGVCKACGYSDCG